MAFNYLKQKISNTTFKMQDFLEVKNICNDIIKSIWKKVKSGKCDIPTKRQNINSLILKYRSKYSIKDYEENYRKTKLIKAQQAKSELEKKLEGIKNSINTLKLNQESQVSNKNSLLSSEVRQEYFEAERKKTEEVARKIRKYAIQQKSLEEAISKHLKKLEKQLKIQKEEDMYNNQYEIFMRNQRIKEEREKMQEKKKKRLEDQESLKKSQSQSYVHLQKKPLFQVFEEKYNTEILMPELERRKEELKKKRAFLSPVQSDQLKEHNLWYDSVKDAHKKKTEEAILEKQKDLKLNKNFDSAWTARIKEEEKQAKHSQIKSLLEKQMLREKRNNYAELVQEVYSPKFSLESNEKKLRDSVEEKKSKMRVVKSDGELENDKPWKPKKFKPNKCLPPPKPQVVPKVVDYLKERRIFRNDDKMSTGSPKSNKELKVNYSDSEDLEEIKKKAMKLEELARKRALQSGLTPDPEMNYKNTEDVSDLLIGSIKAKLYVLQKMD